MRTIFYICYTFHGLHVSSQSNEVILESDWRCVLLFYTLKNYSVGLVNIPKINRYINLKNNLTNFSKGTY